MSGDDADALVDFVNGAIDVAESALLEALGEGVVFFAGDILVGLFEELLGAVEAASVVEARVNRRMIVEVFAVVDGSVFDFVDGVVDGVDGVFLFVTKLAAIVTFEMGASGAKIAESVEISGMLALRKGLARCER